MPVSNGLNPPPVQKNTSAFSDPAFAANKTLPVHRWVPWIAGFSSDFVREAVERYTKAGDTVLDPFAGVGTTLVESVAQGRTAIGFEINPYAALAARLKSAAHTVCAAELRQVRCAFGEYCTRYEAHIPRSLPPANFKGRAAFYSPKVLQKVLVAQDFICDMPSSLNRDLLRLAFGATLVRYSNYSYEPSLGRRASAGKPDILDWPVAQTIGDKLEEMASDSEWFGRHTCAAKGLPGRVITDSFFCHVAHIAPKSVDLIVTSPPYLNNYHYNRNTRPHLYWLGWAHSPKDFHVLEQETFGKYWQTVRDLPFVGLNFDLLGSDLHEQIHHLRGLHHEKGNYGGNGWANYAATYFNDCFRFANAIQTVLKPGGTALVVLGNSILQGVMLPTDQYFARIAEFTGLEVVTIHQPRPTRVGNSIITSEVRVEKAQAKHRLYEAVVELKRR